MIRKATEADASRIAEILIFAKRVHYRAIFQNDAVSFGEMQVYPLAGEFLAHPERLQGTFVYDDEFVKGLVHVAGDEIVELYVDPFFEGQGIGGKLISYAIEQHRSSFLWVLEKNENAIRFYQKHGFLRTNERQPEPDTTEYLVKMVRQGK